MRLYFEYHYIINLLPTNLYNHILFHLFINIYYYYYCYYVKLLIFTRFFKWCRRVVSSAGNDEIKVDIRGGERLDARMLGSSAKRHHNNHHLHNVSQRRLADLWIDDSHVPLLLLGRPGAEATLAVNRISAWARWASRASPRCFGGNFDSLAGRRVGGHGRIPVTPFRSPTAAEWAAKMANRITRQCASIRSRVWWWVRPAELVSRRWLFWTRWRISFPYRPYMKLDIDTLAVNDLDPIGSASLSSGSHFEFSFTPDVNDMLMDIGVFNNANLIDYVSS